MKAIVIALTALALSAQPVMASGDGSAAKSRASLYGTLIGLAAGVAAGGLFFGLSNCHYGSDSGAAIAACAGVTGGLIVGGAFAGRAIGRKIATRPAQQPENASMTLREQQAESARVARTIHFGRAFRGLHLSADVGAARHGGSASPAIRADGRGFSEAFHQARIAEDSGSRLSRSVADPHISR